jgi:hypothetical protein
VDTPKTSDTQETTPEQAVLPVSATVHLELGGHQVQLTLHDTDEMRVLARMEALLQQYPQTATPAYDTLHDPRPAPMRSRIQALLQGYPAGLTRKEIQQKLHVDRNLKDTLYGMVRNKLLGTNGKGVYILVSGKSPTKAS